MVEYQLLVATEKTGISMTYQKGYEYERICANESNNSTWSSFLKEGRTTLGFLDRSSFME